MNARIVLLHHRLFCSLKQCTTIGLQGTQDKKNTFPNSQGLEHEYIKTHIAIIKSIVRHAISQKINITMGLSKEFSLVVYRDVL